MINLIGWLNIKHYAILFFITPISYIQSIEYYLFKVEYLI